MFCEVVCVCGWCHGYQLIYSYGYGNIRPKKKKNIYPRIISRRISFALGASTRPFSAMRIICPT